MGNEAKHLKVPGPLNGTRLDHALARMAGLSRSRARRLIESGRAGGLGRRGELRPLPKTRVAEGDVVWFLPETDDPIRSAPYLLDVLFEDPYLAVVNKPAGMVTHPGPGNRDGTLVSALLNLWPEVEGVGEYPRWGIVHRLDKDTSGAMVVALRQEAQRLLSDALAARAVRREYLALVHGLFPVGTGTIEAPIDRRRARRFVGPRGKPAVTHYRRLASWYRPELSLLEVRLETGRTHQIRVHLESIGHHVVGDPVYGRPAGAAVDPGRVWLHAHRLRFRHPISDVEVDARADLSDDLRTGLGALGVPDRGTIPGTWQWRSPAEGG